MKTTRTVTAEVVAANKRNSQRSPGPTTARGKRFSAANRRTHNLLSGTVVFASEEERAEYNDLIELWRRDCDPDDMIEAALVKEIADAQWRLRQISPWESAAIRARRIGSISIIKALAQDNASHFSAPDLPVVNNTIFRDNVAGWECVELTLTSGRSKDVTPSQSVLSATEESAGDRVGVDVKLTSSLDTVMRYRSAITREFDRAIGRLTQYRAQRSDGE